MKTNELNTNQYPEPSPELIADIRNRLTQVTPDVLERAHHALMHQPIDHAGSILYKAGVCFCSAELYEYRKTLFPPNALVDPLTQGAPVLQQADRSGDNSSASPELDPPTTDNALSPQSKTDSDPAELHRLRQRLVDLLSARAKQLATDNKQLTPNVEPRTTNSEPPTENSEPRTLNRGPDPVSVPKRRNGLGLEDIDPWPDPVDGAALLEDLRQVLRRYVVLPPMAPEALALWVVHTYAFELRNVSTYIGLGSPQKRCGKTTLLTVLTELVSRPVVASNISPPALFRAIEEARPTLLIDEADTFLQANDEMRGILNSGYTRKTAYVVRVANEPERRNADGQSAVPQLESLPRNHDSRLVRFSCWCPKVIAAIGRLPDTLLDRCIPITMQRKTPEESCERLRHLDAQALRRKCARFVTDHAASIAAARPEIPAQLNDRAADIWEPLLVISDLAAANWPKLAREAAIQMSAGMPDSTVIGSLLIDILHIFIAADVERISSRDLVDSLNAFRDRPWAEARKCKEIDGLWLAQQLRPYGVRPKAMWRDGKTIKGYAKSDFEQIWPRYVSRSDFDTLIADRGVAPAQPRNADCQSAVPQVANLHPGNIHPTQAETNDHDQQPESDPPLDELAQASGSSAPALAGSDGIPEP